MASIADGKGHCRRRGVGRDRAPRAVEVTPSRGVHGEEPLKCDFKSGREGAETCSGSQDVGKDPDVVVRSPKLAVEAGAGCEGWLKVSPLLKVPVPPPPPPFPRQGSRAVEYPRRPLHQTWKNRRYSTGHPRAYRFANR